MSMLWTSPCGALGETGGELPSGFSLEQHADRRRASGEGKE